ncbi:hypothetical protein D3C86_1745520 [compost metagenome]
MLWRATPFLRISTRVSEHSEAALKQTFLAITILEQGTTTVWAMCIRIKENRIWFPFSDVPTIPMTENIWLRGLSVETDPAVSGLITNGVFFHPLLSLGELQEKIS